MQSVEIHEGKARILVPDIPRLKGPGRKHAGFYNPLMQSNRDLSVLVLKALAAAGDVRRPLDGMAGTGIRGIRWALEVPSVEVGINEPSKIGAELVKKNLELNGPAASVYASGIASAVMVHKADLVDIDPFGTPVPFFFPVVQNIRKGYVSVTATDTAALTGTIPRVTARRYHATVSRSSITHEVGLRILIGALVRDAARVEREVVPVLSHYADHYYRLYLRLRRNALGADRVLGLVGHVEWEGHRIGPLWTGRLADEDLLKKIASLDQVENPAATDRVMRLVDLLAKESRVERDGAPVIGFFKVDNLARESRTQPMPPSGLVKALEEEGFRASRTHFDMGGVRTDATKEETLGVVRKRAKPSAG